MPNLKITDMRVFLPAKNYEISKKFYTALGWTITWEDDNLAVCELDGHTFYLQNYYNKDWANNTMLFFAVADTGAWFEHISAVLAEHSFPNTRVRPPKDEDYGARVTHVWDPSGVLLHFAQWMDT